jgi:hypothetical protein
VPPTAEAHHATHIISLLRARGGKHLRARKRGAALIVESGPSHDPVKHVRVRRDTVHLWCLDVADHTGRWERTPIRGTLDDVVRTLVDEFPWTLTPVA